MSEEPSATPEGAQRPGQQPTQPSTPPGQGWVSPGGPAQQPHGGPPAQQPPGGPPAQQPQGGPPHQPYGASPPPFYAPPAPQYPSSAPPQYGAPYLSQAYHPQFGPATVPFPPPALQPLGGAVTAGPATPASTQPRIEPVPGTEFGLAYFSVPPTVSGQAVGALVAGILSVVVSLVVGCFGISGAKPGWGPLVGGAFAVLAATAGLGAIGLGVVSVRQIARSGGRLTGRGTAIAGIVCGGAGIALTALSMVIALSIRI